MSNHDISQVCELLQNANKAVEILRDKGFESLSMIPALTTELKDPIKAHAIETPKAECIGLIVRTGDGQIKAIRSSNASDKPADEAIVSDLDFALAAEEGEVIGLYHSHVGGDYDFSKEDIIIARQEKLWMVLYHVPTNSWQTYHPDEKLPLIGRQWHTHYRNCYDLVRDAVFEIFGHEMDYFYMERPNRIKRIDVGYVANLPGQGFTRIDRWDDVQKGDLILCYNGCDHPNHCIVAIGGTEGIHHDVNCVSGRIKFDGLPGLHSLWRLNSAT